MSSDDVTFNCYFNGKFRNNRGNIVTYIGGEVHTLECNPQALFSNLMSSLDLCLYGQRIWYKMPYESNSELKLMCNSEADFNFQRMCTASLWTKVVDIFLEKDDAHENDGGGADATASRGGVHDNYGDEVVEEEARVEANIAGFVDESEHCNSEVTPPNSDDEEVQSKRRYERFKKGSGELRLEQVFDSISAFKEAVVEYVLKTGRNVKYTRWGSEISEVRCSIGGGCPFRIYCAYDERPDMFIIKFFEDKHTCNRDGFCKILTEGVIARLFLNDIRNDPDLKPKYMQDQLQQHYDLGVSHDQCRKAKKKAFKLLEEEFDEQFSRLQDYSSNPYSTCELQTVNGTGTMERFDRFYVCFHNIRTIWRHFCRPIIGIDGCFLKNNVKGQLLVAVGRDANNQFYPMAWAVVQVESTKTWLWFIEKLKVDLELKDGDGFTLISDRQKDLINAVDQLLPKVEHRMCARHVYGNLARVFPGRSQMKKFFWIVAKSYNQADYDAAIEAMKNCDIRVYETMMTKNPQHCSQAFFTNKACCEDVSNNFVESYNGTIEKARAMPLLEMLETIKRQAMVRIDVRKKKANDHTGKYSEKVANFIAEEERFRKFCKAFPGSNGTYEVKENSEVFKVHMVNRTCACRKFDLVGIPCRHGLRVIWQRKENAEDYVFEWYLTAKWQAQYNDSIQPMNGMKFWRKSGMPRLENPPRDISLGPKKKEKRKKSKFESPKKKGKGKCLADPQKKQVKATKEGRIIRCGRCGLHGHNMLKCTLVADGVPIKKKVKKSCPSELEESMSLEGPTQPSQN